MAEIIEVILHLICGRENPSGGNFGLYLRGGERTTSISLGNHSLAAALGPRHSMQQEVVDNVPFDSGPSDGNSAQPASRTELNVPSDGGTGDAFFLIQQHQVTQSNTHDHNILL
jgi:hypothetical protein